MKSNNSWQQELSLPLLARHAAVMNLSLGGIILGSLYQDAEIWLQDYPQAIQDRYGTKSAAAKRWALFWAVPFFAILVGGTIYSNIQLRRAHNGRLSRQAAFANAYLLLLSFWLFDLTIIDWLIMVGMKPSFAILPGTEGMAEYEDAMYHLRVSWPFLFVMAIPSGMIALATATRQRTA